MPKIAHAARVAYIRSLSQAAEAMHVETALLIEALGSMEPIYTKSAKAALKPKRIHARKP